MKKLPFLIFLSIMAIGCRPAVAAAVVATRSTSARLAETCRPFRIHQPIMQTRLDAFTKARCYDVAQHWKHDAQRRTSQKLHDTLIRMWYSPSLFKWMSDKNPLGARQGPVPDGAMVVKEEFPNETGPEDFWSVMVKDSSLWWDGWYWRVVGTEVGAASVPAAAASPGACAEPEFGGSGPPVLTASAATPRQTITSPERNLLPYDIYTYEEGALEGSGRSNSC